LACNGSSGDETVLGDLTAFMVVACAGGFREGAPGAADLET
jgi:hypothetical protein